jgi:predicted Zn-dependent protease with MMP-like domain
VYIYIYLGVEQEAVEIANVATSKMVEIELKLVEDFRDKQQAIILWVKEFDGDLVVDDTNIDLGLFGLPLKP